jgi:hypothetical protein
MGVALLLVGLTHAANAQQSPYPPVPGGTVEPTPVGPSMQMVPGPISPRAAPPGPPDELGIPASIPGAFDEGWYQPEKFVYFHVGAMALQRRRPGLFPIAFADPVVLDTGMATPGAALVAQDLSQAHPRFAWGPRASLGLLSDGGALELTGYYLPTTSTAITTTSPGQLISFFTTPPLGFEGNNGLWDHADQIVTTLRTQLGNAELNYRWWSKAVTGADCIIGIRYFDMKEGLSIFTDDDGIVFPDAQQRPDPLRQATYEVTAHNRILGPQVGIEWQFFAKPWLSIGCWGKTAWGVNFVDVDVSLVRGDGRLGFEGERSNFIYSGLCDLGGSIEVHLLERLRLRGGYNALWLLHVPVANQQLDYNLQNTTGGRKDNGSVFYHGPMAELQFLF